MGETRKASENQTWPVWGWPDVEQQLIQFLAQRDETHLVSGKGVLERTVERLERSGGGKSYLCPHCKYGKDKHGYDCRECGGTAILYSFRASPNRVDFFTSECQACSGSGQYVRQKHRHDLLEVHTVDKRGKATTELQFKMFVDPNFGQFDEWAICLECVERPENGTLINRGRGYHEHHLAIPSPAAPPAAPNTDSPQHAVILPVARMLRRMKERFPQSHDFLELCYGPFGTEALEKYERRDLVLWLSMPEGVELLRHYGDPKITDGMERMAKLLKTTNKLHRSLVDEAEEAVIDLMSTIKSDAWKADMQTGGGVLREVQRWDALKRLGAGQ